MKQLKLVLGGLLVVGILFQPKLIADEEVYSKNVSNISGNVYINRQLGTFNQKSNINVIIDGQYVPFDDYYGYPYIDSQNRTLVPLRVVCEFYDMEVTWDQKRQEALLVKQNMNIKVVNGASHIYVNNNKVEIDTKAVSQNNRLYIPIRFVMEPFGNLVEWDSIINSVVIISKENIGEFPPFYDGRTLNQVTEVRNQGPLGTCWAFANLAALETTLMPNQQWNFSEDHLSFNTGYNITQSTGGNNMMATAYLLGWRGPVREKDDPYGDGITNTNLKPVVHVQGYNLLPDGDIEAIKRAVMRYGGVQTSFYMPLANATSTSNYYNASTNALYYDGARTQNHDVVIVGWDDNYPVENFSPGIRPSKNGAFICKNSWGTGFGDKGYLYISYEGKQFLLNNIVYTRVDDIGVFDNIYQTDLLGWVGTVGYGKTSAYFSNVYTTKGKENVKAVGFYTVDPRMKYEVYIVPKFVSTNSLNSRTLVAEGSLEQVGFYTIDFEKEVPIEANTKYAVIVKVITEKPTYNQIPIEYVSGEQTKNVVLTDGEGYRSYDGRTWDRTEIKLNANICLKAYTKNTN